MDKESLKVLLGRGLSVEEIAKRLRRHPSTVSYWMKKHGLVANGSEKHSAKEPIERDQLEELVNAGMTIREIAAAVDRSTLTVRRWLARFGLRTRQSSHADQQRAAREAGLSTATLECPRHGESEHALSGDGYYRCKRCRVESVVRRRRKVKGVLVTDAGGKCQICGYDRYIGALQFHHLDPKTKRLALGSGGVALALETLRAESRKCVLLCSNCHAEVEGGVTQLPGTVAA